MRTSTFLSLTIILSVIFISHAIPLPSRSPGYQKGSLNAPIHFDMFGDFQCPYTKAGYKIINTVLDHYGPDKIRFNWVTYPIWSHRQAWDAALAVAVIVNENDTKNVTTWDIVQYFLDHQIEFANFRFADKTENDLLDLFAGYAKDLTGLDKDKFMKGMARQDIFYEVDHCMHLGVTKSVLGTPTFFINGFKVPSVDSMTSLEEWIKIIDPLLA
eukprot:TRINITY_DN6974_c0_g1_i1.p1 TRINITY_DN6974_c0_g1~~TRINITY_DN6974_c0_g1_i1.p1  ORF type:complete len:214 (-),score=44.08 TRINITY_DN6974_c0_g1_i1:25-666(-)